MSWPEVFNYGVPTGLLFVVVYAVYRLVLWAKETVVEPVTRSHIELIEALRSHMPKQAEAVERMLENQAAIIELLKTKKDL